MRLGHLHPPDGKNCSGHDARGAIYTDNTMALTQRFYPEVCIYPLALRLVGWHLKPTFVNPPVLSSASACSPVAPSSMITGARRSGSSQWERGQISFWTSTSGTVQTWQHALRGGRPAA